MPAPDDKRMHVMHLLPRLNRDGTTHMVTTLIEGLDRARYRITLCGLSPGDADRSALEALADQVHVLDMRSFWDFRTVLPLRALLRDDPVDILHTHRIRPDLIGRVAGRMAGVPVNVSTQHYVEEWKERGPAVHRVVRTLFKATMPWCRTVVCNSAAESTVLLEEIGLHYRDVLSVIHNGLDMNRFAPPARNVLDTLRNQLDLSAQARVIGIVAFLTERKGHRFLLEAMAGLRAEFPELVLLVVGDGPEDANLRAYAHSLGLDAMVRFLGKRGDVAALTRICEVSVLPSLWEPFGLAALEAMAVATPVIAANSGGLPEFIEHERNGLLVEPGNADALAQALRRLLDAPEEARRLGEAGQRTVLEGFTATHVARAYERLYEELLGKR